MARVIALEGPDGVGKTTIAHALVEVLDKEGEPAVYRSSPGHEGGTLGKLVHNLHHDASLVGVTRPLDPTSLQLLHVAAQVDALERDVLAPIGLGTSVILDRFWWSTWVYGMAAGLDETLLKMMIEIERLSWRSNKPDAVILVSRTLVAEDVQLRRGYDRLAEEERSSYPVHRLVNDSSLEEAVGLAHGLIVTRGTA